jgi:tetratricopeptide (TPR) repeat protein
LDQAEKRLEQAVDIYPRYAAAWFALGQAQEHSKQLSDARNSYLAAIKADSKYVSPYDRLALLSASQNKWQEAADYSQQAIDLNPIEYPSSFWYNAIANYNLHNMDQAQKSAAALVKLDVNHKYPEAERLLAQISLAKNNYADAGNHLRAYLQVNPNAKDADALKQTLLKIDQASTEFKQ